MPKSPLQRLVLGALFVCFYVPFLAGQTLQTTTTPCDGCTVQLAANCFRFTLTDPSIIDPADFAFFWVFGDGAVKFEPVNTSTGEIIHCYPPYDPGRSNDYHPYVEYHQMDNYIDDEPPESKSASLGNNFGSLQIPNGGTYLSNYPNEQEQLNGLDYRLSISRIPVPGDSISYLVHVKNNCTVQINTLDYTLSVNENLLTPLTNSSTPPFLASFPHVYIPTNGQTKVSLNGNGDYEITFLDLAPQEERTVVFKYKVKLNNLLLGRAISATLSPGPTCTLETTSEGANEELGNCLCGAEPNNSGEVVERTNLSHDPNYLVSGDPPYCDETLADLLNYRIRFQNTGVDSTEKIKVRVWLDEDVDMASVDYLGTSTFKLVSGAMGERIVSSTSERWVEWELDQAYLQGTANPGYLVDFQEEATIEYIDFSVAINTTDYPNHINCDAFPARAAIYFDCNEPIVTNDFLITAGCIDTVPPNNQPSCIGCTTFKAVLSPLPIDSSGTNFEFNPDLVDLIETLNLRPNIDKIQWFPIQNVVGQTSKGKFLNIAGLPPVYPIDHYTMIVVKPDSCIRWEIKMPVVWPSCDMSFPQDEYIYDICGGNRYDNPIQITVNDPHNNGPYEWQNCDPANTTNTLTINRPLVPGIYPIFVQDANGCFAKTILKVVDSEVLYAEPTWVGCFFTVAIVGGTPPYTLEGYDPNLISNGGWKAFPTGVTIDGNQLSEFRVTDSNGCTYLFDGKCGPKPSVGPFGLPWVVVIGLGIAVVVGVILLFRRPGN